MGLLSEGSPLSWKETKEYAEHVRKHGIIQFINQYKKLQHRNNDILKYGDEIEYNLVELDHDNKRARLLLDAERILAILQQNEKNQSKDLQSIWRPEYASYMVEGTPGKPYGCFMAHFNMVEANMKKRLGCPDFTSPEYRPTPKEGASRSLFYPEQAIMQGHPRYRTLTRNIRERRGKKVVINVPIYKDQNTPSPFIEDFGPLGDDGEAQTASLPDHIYLDCMGFGMGLSCLQMTFQACCTREAKELYDHLTPLCPILMALSAASPIFRGYLADIDCRWSVISGSVDDRTAAELGEVEMPADSNTRRIYKSRYDSIDSYLSPTSICYNDIELVKDEALYSQMVEDGVDTLLAQHVAHLFIRDPVSLFSEKINQNDEQDTDHFENIQSTNWQTMRFKPPPPNSEIGWRVEFRPTEVQLTDFENAAFTVFVVLMTRVILSFNLNLLIPISKVDANMKTAQNRDAVRKDQFYFKHDLLTGSSPPEAAACLAACGTKCDPKKCKSIDDQYELMTIDEIINGKSLEFSGLVPLIENYMDSVECDVDTRCTISQYLNLIKMRASGELMTTARWMREFVTHHPQYKQDSVVSEEITYDLIRMCDRITRQEVECPELLINYDSKTQDGLPPGLTKYYEAFSNGKTS